MTQIILLNPEKIKAIYDNSSNTLTIEASGTEDGICNIQIQQVPMNLQNNEFMVIGEHTPAIGSFPYNISANFHILNAPKNIIIKTTTGDKQVPVSCINQPQQNANPASKSQAGLFLAQYLISTPSAPYGSPVFSLFLTVCTPSGTVTGAGNITQTTNPPLNLGTKLEGSFTYMTVMPKQTSILVTAQGYPAVNWSPHAGIGPVLQPNVELRMVLGSDWKSGTANYKYLTSQGQWNCINNAQAELVNNSYESQNSNQAHSELESLS